SVGRMEFQNISIWGTAALEAYSRVFSESAGIPAPTYLDRFSGLLHDAFVMYANALNKSLEAGNNVSVMDTAETVLFTAVFLLLVVSAIVWRWKRERDLLKMTWKIEYGDLNFDNRSRKMHSSVDFDNQYGSNINQSRDLKSRTSSVQSGTSSVGFRQVFTDVAIFQGEIVAVKYSSLKKVREDRDFLLKMKCLKEIKHDNIVMFIGVCLSSEKVCSVWEYCKKGSIQDIIGNESIRLDAMFKLSIAVDVCKGLDYIHNNKTIRCHGNLRSSNCVVDSRWVCKLTHFGIERLTPAPETPQSIGEHAFYTKLFWTAPEILRKIFLKKEIEKTPQSDVYSLGVILMELVCRSEPYSSHQDLSPKEIILKVARSSTGNNIFRPIVSDNMLDRECSGIGIICLIEDCWTENPNSRPNAKNVLKTLLKISPFKKLCVVDNMILMMEKYTNDLETIVCERTQQLEEEKIKTETLLFRMLPRKIANDLKLGNTVQAEAYESVTIYFSDIVQFTNIASESTPLQIVCLLNELYTLFDEIISSYDVYKVETIGDAYMVVSGLPEENDNEHVKEIARVSIKILADVLTFRIPHRTHEQLRIRIGLHTGPVVAGVVGLTMPRYCLFGDMVNTASRMESNGEPLRIHISPETKEALSCFPNFLIEERGVVPIKGKGLMRTYWLIGELEEHTCKETDSAGLTNDKLC
ncbi:atrial natriuretic peptide receptor 2-like, partial [Ruditapes philippinarum]|uniref:atrial natriuretic peptide receptor 2-like n=1 Tax=Ruditapes philippinarum TaxID=129788 RepID=UPI00295A65CF